MKRLWLHAVLFLATVASTFWAFLWQFTDPQGPLGDRVIDSGLFAFCAMLILGAHEMGHYLMARQHDVDSSLPYFIPLGPLSFGTMGAVIRLKGRIPNRNALVDIGAAGPLAGLAIAIPLLIIGIQLCRIGDAPAMPDMFPGSSSLWALAPKLIALIRTGEWPTAVGAQFYGNNLLTWGAQQWLIGPLPPGKDLYVHPVFLAAWFGMVVTMLNLMPIGQLDAGHLTFAWFGRHAVLIGKVMSAVLVVFIVFFSATWILWFLLTRKLVGYNHPEVTLPDEPLSAGRKVVCAVCFVFFALTLMPVVISL